MLSTPKKPLATRAFVYQVFTVFREPWMQEQLGMCVLFGFVTPAFDFACVLTAACCFGQNCKLHIYQAANVFWFSSRKCSRAWQSWHSLTGSNKSKKMGKKEVKPHSLFARTPINVNHTHRNRTVVACSSSKRSIKREMTWASQKHPQNIRLGGSETSDDSVKDRNLDQNSRRNPAMAAQILFIQRMSHRSTFCKIWIKLHAIKIFVFNLRSRSRFPSHFSLRFSPLFLLQLQHVDFENISYLHLI